MTIEKLQIGEEKQDLALRYGVLSWPPLLPLLVGAVVLIAGAIEGRYGKSELYGDDISYLDVANMIRSGDWRAAFNPLWSIGYPLLLSFVRRSSSPTPHGEMMAVFWLNLFIYFAAWLGFLWLLRLMVQVLRGRALTDRADALSPFLLISAACIFVTVQTGVGRLSTVGPDLLVTCLFFFASALLLKTISVPTRGTAAALGVVLGLGFLSKAIFLILSSILFAVAIVFKGRRNLVSPLFLSGGVFLLFVITYSFGMSWALGRPTLGEAGALNYAFHVNNLSHWMGWQGGPPELGSPIHPVQMLYNRPPVFAFGEPFHVTYPPQFNMVYWYEGYRPFFNFKNTIHAVLGNIQASEYVFQDILPVVAAVVLCCCFAFWPVSRASTGEERSWYRWILYLPSVLGCLVLLWVHMEGRYVTGFVSVLAVAPFLELDSARGSRRSVLRMAALLFLVVATAFNAAERLHSEVRLAVQGADMQSEGQWAIAQYLRSRGLMTGDKVASVAPKNEFRCTWAYAAKLHIVAAIGNDAYDPQNQVQDLHLFFENPSVQAEVLELFRRQGVVAVVATEIPFDVSSPGWERIPGGRAWMFLLRPSASAVR
jgi:hypothetical protein